MSGYDHRLRSVTAGLSPKEAVLAWMARMHRFESREAYLAWLTYQPTSVYPLFHLPDQQEQAVRRALRIAAKADVADAIRRAQREVVFLFLLQSELNTVVAAQEEGLGLRLLLVAEKIVCRSWQGIAAACGAPPDGGPTAMEDRENLLREATIVRARLGALEGSALRIAERYFDGQDVLFPDLRASLADLRATLEG